MPLRLFLIVSMSCGILGWTYASAAPTTDSAVPSNDELISILKAKASEIRALQAEFTLSRLDVGDTLVALKWDLVANRINATVSHSAHNRVPNVFQWIRNEREEWLARAELNDDVPDTWAATRSEPRKLDLQEINEVITGLPWLDAAITPAHIRQQRDGTMLEGSRYVIVGAKVDPNTDRLVVLFNGVLSNTKLAEIDYELDSAKGFALAITKILNVSRGAVSISSQLELGDLVQSNGVFFPKNIRQRRWTNNRVFADERIIIRSLTVNPEFGENDFRYIPPFATRVSDASGKWYRVGYKNPHSAVGRDANDTRAIENDIRAAKESAAASKPVP